MKKLIQTLKHIWAVDELRNKIVVTLVLVLTYRLGTQITLPGIDPNKIEAASAAAQGNGLLGIFDMFAGGAFSQASILALGIMPYISASIFMQLIYRCCDLEDRSGCSSNNFQVPSAKFFCKPPSLTNRRSGPKKKAFQTY